MSRLPPLGNIATYRTAVAALIAFVLISISLGAQMTRTISPYDEALILVGAERVQEGAVPYRDFYANYGPGSFYVIAALFKTFGVSVLVERAWDVVVRASTVMIAFHLVRVAAPFWVSCISAVLVMIWLGEIGIYAYPIWPCLLFCLLSLLCIARSLDSSAGNKWLLAAGCSAGMVALFRFDVGFYAIVALCLSAVLGGRRRLAPMMSGIAVTCGPVAIALIFAGALPDLIFDNLTFPARFYAATRGLPFPTVHDVLNDPYQLAVYAPLAVVPAAILALAADSRSKTRDENSVARRWIVVSLSSLSMALYVKGIVRVSISGMALSFIPTILLALVSLVFVRRVSPSIKTLLFIALGFVIVPSVPAIKNAVTKTRETLTWAVDSATWSDTNASATCRPPAYLERMRCLAIDPTWAKVVAEVERLSNPNEPIFVGLPHHDRIFINDMMIYFATHRRPATKWYHFDPGLQTSDYIQREMISEIKAAHPPVVVIDDTWTKVREPNASAISSKVTKLDDYLTKEYRKLDHLGNYDIEIPQGE